MRTGDLEDIIFRNYHVVYWDQNLFKLIEAKEESFMLVLGKSKIKRNLKMFFQVSLLLSFVVAKLLVIGYSPKSYIIYNLKDKFFSLVNMILKQPG